jgi:hypothetical protein
MFSKSMYILYLLVFFIVVVAGYARVSSPEIIRNNVPREAKTNNPPSPVCPSAEMSVMKYGR